MSRTSRVNGSSPAAGSAPVAGLQISRAMANGTGNVSGWWSRDAAPVQRLRPSEELIEVLASLGRALGAEFEAGRGVDHTALSQVLDAIGECYALARRIAAGSPRTSRF